MGLVRTLAADRCILASPRTTARILRLAEARVEIVALNARIAELEAANDAMVSTSTDWATGNEAARRIAELTDQLRAVEEQNERYFEQEFADGNDPVPKATYREKANEAWQAKAAAEEHIRKLQTERDAWRAELHAKLVGQSVARANAATSERDDAIRQRDELASQLHAAQQQMTARSRPAHGAIRVPETLTMKPVKALLARYIHDGCASSIR